MNLSLSDAQKLEQFLQRIHTQTYPEPPSELHTSLSRKMWDHCRQTFGLPAGAKILDVGCGQGVALEFFREQGFHAVGITLNAIDVESCRKKGFQVYEMDQSFLRFGDAEFDLIWCRHCLEHSIFPYFTLSEFYRVLRPQGYLYVEVPAPETHCRHETNQNHYSVMGKSMWYELMRRTGFRVLDVVDISFEVKLGPDLYWAFLQQKGQPQRN